MKVICRFWITDKERKLFIRQNLIKLKDIEVSFWIYLYLMWIHFLRSAFNLLNVKKVMRKWFQFKYLWTPWKDMKNIFWLIIYFFYQFLDKNKIKNWTIFKNYFIFKILRYLILSIELRNPSKVMNSYELLKILFIISITFNSLELSLVFHLDQHLELIWS